MSRIAIFQWCAWVNYTEHEPKCNSRFRAVSSDIVTRSIQKIRPHDVRCGSNIKFHVRVGDRCNGRTAPTRSPYKSVIQTNSGTKRNRIFARICVHMLDMASSSASIALAVEMEVQSLVRALERTVMICDINHTTQQQVPLSLDQVTFPGFKMHRRTIRFFENGHHNLPCHDVVAEIIHVHQLKLPSLYHLFLVSIYL